MELRIWNRRSFTRARPWFHPSHSRSARSSRAAEGKVHERNGFPTEEEDVRRMLLTRHQSAAPAGVEIAPPLRIQVVAPRLLCLALSSALGPSPGIRLVDGPADALVLASDDWEERLGALAPKEKQADHPGLLLV